MSLSIIFHSLLSSSRTLPKLANATPTRPSIYPQPKLLSIRSLQRSHENCSPKEPRLENFLSTAASLYPVYVTVGGIVACVKPSAFSWFVSRGPASYSFSLAFIMLAMGLTLELKDLSSLFMQKPLSGLRNTQEINQAHTGDTEIDYVVRLLANVHGEFHCAGRRGYITKALAGTPKSDLLLIPVEQGRCRARSTETINHPLSTTGFY